MYTYTLRASIDIEKIDKRVGAAMAMFRLAAHQFGISTLAQSEGVRIRYYSDRALTAEGIDDLNKSLLELLNTTSSEYGWMIESVTTEGGEDVPTEQP